MEAFNDLRADSGNLARERLQAALAVWEREKRALDCRWLYVCARRGGKKLDALWITPDQSAAERVERDLGDALRSATSFELEMLHSPRQRYLSWAAKDRWNSLRGRQAMIIELEGQVRRWAASEMIAANISFHAAARQFLAAARLVDTLPRVVPVTLFQTRQLFCDNSPTDGEAAPIAMFRGNRVLPLAAITRTSVFHTARAMTRWLAAHVDEVGACRYKYWPSRGVYAESNNAIRQWMATVCLNRVAKGFGSGRLAAIAKRNLAYNLSSTFRQQEGVGYIWMDGSAKLGAAALAALAIFESPERRSWLRQEYALYGLIHELSNADGSFATFYIPRERNDNQNFYSGEALLFLAARYRLSRDPRELARIMAAFRYYRDWHRANRNPAFVPWHTQAYYLVWQITRDESLADFIFEMNDWLLSMQQWDSAEYPDMQGRFYDPVRPQFGPPHASSTGVYLEGLIDAFALARHVGDVVRKEHYRTAIVRGIRSLMQLQFKDVVDCFYVENVDRVLGGVRTTVYDNTIRVDNVQHALMALLKVHVSFETHDYELAEASGPSQRTPVELSAPQCSALWHSDDVLRQCAIERIFNHRPWSAQSVIARKSRPEAGCIYFAKQALEDELRLLRDRSAQPAAILAEAEHAQVLAEHVPCPVYQVRSLQEAAGSLADAARSRTRARIVGVTGSVGKTSVKDALAQTLAAQAPTHATNANANDGWGVLDTLMNLPSDARFAVMEMGMLGTGSISIKSKRIKPHIGIVTNVHDAHLESHADEASIAATKSGLFDGIVAPGAAILPRDSSWYEYLQGRARRAGVEQVITFGLHPEADFRLREEHTRDGRCVIGAELFGKAAEFEIGVPGRHWAVNAMAALAAAHSLGADRDEAMRAMQLLRPSFRRGEVHHVAAGSEAWTVVDDTWNASPASVLAALDNLNAIESSSRRRILFLGDMLELGQDAIDKHIALIDAIVANRIDKVYTVGKLSRALFDRLPHSLRGEHFDHADLAGRFSRRGVQGGDLVLVKGSHAMEMWRVVRALRKGRNAPGPGAGARLEAPAGSAPVAGPTGRKP